VLSNLGGGLSFKLYTSVFEIEGHPPVLNSSGDRPSIILSSMSNQKVFVAWQDEAKVVHVTELALEKTDTGSTKAAPVDDFALACDDLSLAGFVARSDGGGYALALVEGEDTLWLILVSSPSKSMFRKKLTGLKPKESKGATFAPLCSGSLRLSCLCTGDGVSGHYAAYFASKREFGGDGGPSDVHQGDSLAIVDFVSGELLQHSWAWGVSHSLDQRIISDFSSGYVCAAVGDAYPKGFVVIKVAAPPNHLDRLGNEDLSDARWLLDEEKVASFILDANSAGWANGKLGGLMKLPGNNGYALTVSTAQGREEGSDLGLLRFDLEGKMIDISWLTHTLEASEVVVKSARYGNNILAAWRRDASLLHVLLMDEKAQSLGSIETVPGKMNNADDFITLPNGEVAWAYIGKNNGISRLHFACLSL
jgi:hypothetical protein